MSNPHKPGTPEWQQWLNDEIAKHDREVAARDAKINAELKKQAQNAAQEAAKQERIARVAEQNRKRQEQQDRKRK